MVLKGNDLMGGFAHTISAKSENQTLEFQNPSSIKKKPKNPQYFVFFVLQLKVLSETIP